MKVRLGNLTLGSANVLDLGAMPGVGSAFGTERVPLGGPAYGAWIFDGALHPRDVVTPHAPSPHRVTSRPGMQQPPSSR